MKSWEARLLHVSVILLTGSGLLYGVMKYLMARFEPDSPLGHPWQPSVLKLHILVAPVLVFGIGMLFRYHAMRRIQAGETQGRRNGIIILSMAAPLVMSGYAVQAFVGDAARTWSGWIHAGLGLLFAFAWLLHPRSELPKTELSQIGMPQSEKTEKWASGPALPTR